MSFMEQYCSPDPEASAEKDTGEIITEGINFYRAQLRNLNDIRRSLREYDASVCAWEPDMYVLNPASNRLGQCQRSIFN